MKIVICPDCGSEYVWLANDGLYECEECGVFFDPTHPDVLVDQERIRAGLEPLHSHDKWEEEIE